MALQQPLPVPRRARRPVLRRPLAAGLALASSAILLLAGCGKDGGDSAAASPDQKPGAASASAAPAPATPESPEAAIAAKAARYYQLNCRNCHGEAGQGDGPAAATFNPRPRDYSDPAWQASVTDQQIKDILIQGGAPLGKSGLMQPRPDLARKPELLDALVALVRGFARK